MIFIKDCNLIEFIYSILNDYVYFQNDNDHDDGVVVVNDDDDIQNNKKYNNTIINLSIITNLTKLLTDYILPYKTSTLDNMYIQSKLFAFNNTISTNTTTNNNNTNNNCQQLFFAISKIIEINNKLLPIKSTEEPNVNEYKSNGNQIFSFGNNNGKKQQFIFVNNNLKLVNILFERLVILFVIHHDTQLLSLLSLSSYEYSSDMICNVICQEENHNISTTMTNTTNDDNVINSDITNNLNITPIQSYKYDMLISLLSLMKLIYNVLSTTPLNSNNSTKKANKETDKITQSNYKTFYTWTPYPSIIFKLRQLSSSSLLSSSTTLSCEDNNNNNNNNNQLSSSCSRFIICSKIKTKHEICELFFSIFLNNEDINNDEIITSNEIISSSSLLLLESLTPEQISQIIKTKIVPHFIFRELIQTYQNIGYINDI
eukprot:UN02565